MRLPSAELVQAIERATGFTAEQLRREPLDEARTRIEKQRAHRMHFISHFPFIGRGSILHGQLVDHDHVEQAVTEALQ